METKRVVVLVLLCVLVFVGWSILVNRLYPPAPPGTSPGPSVAASAGPGPVPTATPAPVKPVDPGPGRQPAEAEQEFILENKHLRLSLTNRGAGVRSADIKIPGQPSFRVLEVPASGVHLGLEALESADDLAKSTWTVRATEPGKSVTYGYLLRDGREVERRYILEGDFHSLKVLTSAWGGDEKSAPLRFRVKALQGVPHDTAYYYDRYGTGAVSMKASGGSPKLHTVAIDQPHKDGKPVEFRIPTDAAEAWPDWFGLRNRFFVALVVPESEFDRKWIHALQFRDDPRKDAATGAELKGLAVDALTGPVPAGPQRFTVQHKLFLAPIQGDALREVPGGSEFINYGCCGLITPVGELIVWILNGVHAVVPNYGWAILITTLLVKLALFPITKKGQVSMARMSELQPKIQALQARHRDDPQRMNQEMWKLWKEEKVAPWSGCLPLMIQMPIFIGLYSVFDTAVEFRNAPFVGWIHDLSQPDRFHVLSSPISFWFIHFQEINLLPPLMTVAWFLQALTAPKSPDPNMAVQQKMFLFMPLMFGFMTYSVASGLSLYMCMNFILGLAEQKLIKTFWLPKKAPVPAKA